MREIFFRGKDADNGEWVYGYYAHFKNMHDVKADIIYTGYADMYMGSILPECYDINPKTIGQYTGLTDKNGTRVFEGDIVNYNGSIHKVVFENRYYNARFGIVVEEKETWSFGMSVPPYLMEVIGNIHDNPELLEVKQ